MSSVSTSRVNPVQPPSHADRWELRAPFGWKAVLALALVMVALAWSAQRTEIDKGIRDATQGLTTAVGNALGTSSGSTPVTRGVESFASRAWPIVIARETPVHALDADFNPATDLARFSRIESRPIGIEGASVDVVVEPVGYLTYVLGLMLGTIEIAVWGTLLALVLAIPLAYCAASTYSPHPLIYGLARGLCSLSRAIPELVSALVFVVLFGVGPFAGVLALGFHTAGFLGKFFADDIENTDPGPQEALRATGANPLKVLRFAVIPQILPQVFAYVQYILERNVRTATVLGIVGAGGIGLELIGQWNMYNYGHAATILLVIFATVVVLEHITQRMRRKLI
jgi:phosphonate transport system permease protein